MTRVAIYGGSFNPPHVGHVLAVAYVLATAEIDEVLVVPAFQHPFSKELAGFDDRFALCEAAFGFLPRTSVSKIGYLWQAFALNTLTLEQSLSHAALQRPVIDAAMAGRYDVQAVMPWGLFLGAAELAAEPYLLPLGGTQYEYLVRP